MILTSIAAILIAQQAGEKVTAIHPNKPETWTLEYPRRYAPFVADYYNCLRSQMLYAGEGRTFEAQHRANIPLCEPRESELLEEAAELASGSQAQAEVATLFDRIRQIHVARGKEVDRQFELRLARYMIDEPAIPVAGTAGQVASEPAEPEPQTTQ